MYAHAKIGVELVGGQGSSIVQERRCQFNVRMGTRSEQGIWDALLLRRRLVVLVSHCPTSLDGESVMAGRNIIIRIWELRV